MSEKTYLIPEKLQVGFTKREDSLDGKLSFITYKTPSGEIAQEGQFNRWIDKSIPLQTLNNTPQSGFSMGEHVHRLGSFGANDKFLIRLYSPQGFEFEITMENFLEIAYYAVIDKRFIKGDFIFGWAGNRLHLISTESPEYKRSAQYSHNMYHPAELTSDNIVPGDLFELKKHKKRSLIGSNYVYVGQFNFIKNDDFKQAKLKDIHLIDGEYVWKPKTAQYHIFLKCYKHSNYITSDLILFETLDSDVISKIGSLNNSQNTNGEVFNLENNENYRKIKDLAQEFKSGNPLKLFDTVSDRQMRDFFSTIYGLNYRQTTIETGIYISSDLKKLYSIDAQSQGYSISYSCIEVTLNDIKQKNIKHNKYTISGVNNIQLKNSDYSYPRLFKIK